MLETEILRLCFCYHEDMKKTLTAGFILTILIVAGFLIPLSTYEGEEYVCGGPMTIRLHLIKGDSIDKSREEAKSYQSDNTGEGRCLTYGPTKYKLYIL